jgi:hypothetical protein
MNNDQRISNLQSLGYNLAEAAFLCPAGLHSGYFVRRQYAAYTGKVPGYADVALGEKVVRNGHAKVTVMCHNRMLYHLCSKPFYAALGEDDNRNRRAHESQAIKRRLMMLDFALANQSLTFFPTETEKVTFFRDVLGIGDEFLPRKLYRSAHGGSTTMRYFIDKSPIYIEAEADRNHPAVHFGYVDEGHHSTSGFEQHLREYRPLFARLARLELVYIASSPENFGVAQQVFERLIGAANRVPVDPLVGRTIEYFKIRDAYDRRDIADLNQAKLIQLRADRAAFSDAKFEQLFVQWKSKGDALIMGALCPESIEKPAHLAQFRTYLLPFQYELFGTLTRSKSEGERHDRRK